MIKNFTKLPIRCSLSSNCKKMVYVNKLSGEYNGITELCLNRSDAKNALSRTMIQNLVDSITVIQEDKTVSTVILRSALPGIFCAGADLKEEKPVSKRDPNRLPRYILRQVFQKMANLPMPLIAAVDGHAIGGGLEMALTADFIVVSDNAMLGLVETKLGILPGAGGTQHLPRMVGVSKAKELIYTAALIDGKEAAKIGLANYCVSQTETKEAAYLKALELASQIAKNDSTRVRLSKISILKGLQADINTALSVEDVYLSNFIN